MIAAILIGVWTVLAVSLAVIGARRRRRPPLPAAPRPTGHIRIIRTGPPYDWETDG